MTPSVYIETSIVSYPTSRPSRDVVTAAHQQLTLDWWNHIRPGFTTFVSEVVVQEALLGDAKSARLRLAAIEGVPLTTASTTC